MTTSIAAPTGRHYDVEGRRLFLHTSGTGGPAVVFLPGATAVGLDYLNVHDRVSEFTTSVVYDRAGTGWSDAAELPRSAAAVATELRQLLRTAGIPGPYILVAHSIGGAYARRFAQLFPDEVAGMVHLDAFHEDWDDHMPHRLRLRPQPVPGAFQLRLISRMTRGFYRRMFASWPAEVRDDLVAAHLDPAWQRTGALERSNMPELRDELTSGGPVPDVPVIALTALGVDPGQRLVLSKRSLAEMHTGKQKLDAALAASVSTGEQRVLDGARHSTIAIDAPDAVVQAVRDVWRRAS